MFYQKNLYLLLISAVLFMTGCGQSAPNPDEIISREQQRVEYLTGGELDLLADMMSPTVSYTHSSGILDGKEDFLNSLRSGQVVYRSLDHSDLQVRFVSPDVAILNGISDVGVTVGGVDEEVPLRFTIVYARDGGDWMFEAWHSAGRQN